MELVVSFAYCLILLVVPHLFEVNRVSTKLVALTMLPVFLIKAPVFCSTLNPSIIYGLWYLHNSSSLLNIMNTLPFEHIVGPILGAVLAGLVCNVYFPDDPKSWTRSRSK